MICDAKYFEAMWRRYRVLPSSIQDDWRNAFDFIKMIYGDPFETEPLNPASSSNRQARYLRRFGHRHATLDPLGLVTTEELPDEVTSLAEGISNLKGVYCGTLTASTGHIDDPDMERWINEALETIDENVQLSSMVIFRDLIRAQIFEQIAARKLFNKKRFGVEGADAIIPLLRSIAREAKSRGIEELVVGSMHRGRLSVMANFAGFDIYHLFDLMKGQRKNFENDDTAGDVPYHLGSQGLLDGVQISLLPNPSHLEAINPVATGYTRARRLKENTRAMAVIVHTDASVIGQGVNAELLQMSKLPAYHIGGTLHIIVNNQLGFTTNPYEARTSRYCSGAWRAVDSLLLHVNGEDVDAVLRAGHISMNFRDQFSSDAVIDLVCYRKNGHNELDEPRFTQPRYYKAVDAKDSLSAIYESKAISAGKFTQQQADTERLKIGAEMEAAITAPAVKPHQAPLPFTYNLSKPSRAELRKMVEILSIHPDGVGNPKMLKLMLRRFQEVEDGVGWPLAETLAFATVLQAGISVRASGQDFERGPFSQRHLAAINPETEERYHVLSKFAQEGAIIQVINTPLSEYAVLGFEYGFSIAATKTLTVWEAQFGDFSNGAQIIIDQFIASGLEKWKQHSNLTILLPHGLEGQGPEHSSARIERILQLCARDNLRVIHPSTPSNYYHALVDQAWNGRTPLFVFTPKVLLRHSKAKSQLQDFCEESQFLPIISISKFGARRAIICSGKIAYEIEALAEIIHAAVAIIRLEELYPFPAEAVTSSLVELGVQEFVWLQEEPENFGAGAWLTSKLAQIAQTSAVELLPMIARPESPSPAGSYHARHDADQQILLARALEGMPV